MVIIRVEQRRELIHISEQKGIATTRQMKVCMWGASLNFILGVRGYWSQKKCGEP